MPGSGWWPPGACQEVVASWCMEVVASWCICQQHHGTHTRWLQQASSPEIRQHTSSATRQQHQAVAHRTCAAGHKCSTNALRPWPGLRAAWTMQQHCWNELHGLNCCSAKQHPPSHWGKSWADEAQIMAGTAQAL